MKKVTLAFGLAFALCLTACSEETQTVQWYKEHPEVLAKEFEKCKLKTLAEFAGDKHCLIIEKARSEIFQEHEINAPIHKFDINKWKRQ